MSVATKPACQAKHNPVVDVPGGRCVGRLGSIPGASDRGSAGQPQAWNQALSAGRTIRQQKCTENARAY